MLILSKAEQTHINFLLQLHNTMFITVKRCCSNMSWSLLISSWTAKALPPSQDASLHHLGEQQLHVAMSQIKQCMGHTLGVLGITS